MQKLMIVDDSALVRARIQNEYDQDVFNVVCEAKDGRDAIRLFEEHRPDVVTMDLTMPNVDGIETIETLIALNPKVQILVISALKDNSTGLEALEKGAMGFINKPFTPEELCEALEHLIE